MPAIPAPEYKIIADHLRASSFLVADGVMPSNEGRGYVLRRIMRRAMRQLHKLGTKEVSFYKLVPGLIAEMGEAYPELKTAKALITETLKNEEEKFRSNLEVGLAILKEELGKNQNSKIFSGSVAFKLYDTYGFPLDLTQDILKDESIEVDLAEFDREMELQRKRAKASWVGSGEEKDNDIYFALKEKLGDTEFLGYTQIAADAKILVILKDGKEVNSISSSDEPKQIQIILDRTPFYATSGGQQGDDGTINGSSANSLRVSTVKKFAAGIIVHLISDIKGEFKISDKVQAVVNSLTRKSKAQNHSATHLLHKSLKEILGEQVTQKGSNVESKYLTFDFNFNRPVSESELIQIEDRVNFYITQNSKVKTELMSLVDANSSGALALFGEKYGDTVRVLSMGETEAKKNYSVELCGGTHVSATGDIGIFKIISERGVASGIRRIEAKTGAGAFEHLRLQEFRLKALLGSTGINLTENDLTAAAAEASEKGESLIKKVREKDKEIERLKTQILESQLQEMKGEKIGNIELFIHQFSELDGKELTKITTSVKAKKTSAALAFFSLTQGRIFLCLAFTSDLTKRFDAGKLIPKLAELIGGKGGGGKPDLAIASGVDQGGVKKIIEELRNILVA